MDLSSAYLLHLRTITIIIAPKRADIIETIINVKAHPSSPAASEIKIKWELFRYCFSKFILVFVWRFLWLSLSFSLVLPLSLSFPPRFWEFWMRIESRRVALMGLWSYSAESSLFCVCGVSVRTSSSDGFHAIELSWNHSEYFRSLAEWIPPGWTRA